MSFSISSLHGSTVWKLFRLRDRIQIDPEYQRAGGVWAPDTRQLLIDTIINGFDIPKIYLHKFSAPMNIKGRTYEYAIVDGRQRLETLWHFIDGGISLADDFKYFKEEKVKASGMTYQDLAKEYPELKADFDAFSLAVVLIETDDPEMIEEMFSRLNDAVPLTAPEKRNAYGGPVPQAIRKLASEPFFVRSLPFQNKRYRHFDIASKFLLAAREEEIVDTKKSRLDDFVLAYAQESRTKTLPFLKSSQRVVQAMQHVFADSDALLRQVGMVTVYFHLFRIAIDEDWVSEITRKKLFDFEKLRVKNRQLFEIGANDKVDKDLIEFDSYSQSPNDASAIRFRVSVILDKTFKRSFSDEN